MVSATPPTGVLTGCTDAALNPLIVSPAARPRSAADATMMIVPVVGSYELDGSAVFSLPLFTNRPSIVPLASAGATHDSYARTVGFDGLNYIRTACTATSGSLNETYQY